MARWVGVTWPSAVGSSQCDGGFGKSDDRVGSDVGGGGVAAGKSVRWHRGPTARGEDSFKGVETSDVLQEGRVVPGVHWVQASRVKWQ